MSYLTNTLKSWLASGHRIAEFVTLTGLSPSFCSQLFAGKRDLSQDALAGIIDSIPPKFAMQILRSWMLDHVEALPDHWKERINIQISEIESKLREEEPEIDSHDHAKAWAVMSMEKDPQFMALIRNFWTMVGSPKV